MVSVHAFLGLYQASIKFVITPPIFADFTWDIIPFSFVHLRSPLFHVDCCSSSCFFLALLTSAVPRQSSLFLQLLSDSFHNLLAFLFSFSWDTAFLRSRFIFRCCCCFSVRFSSSALLNSESVTRVDLSDIRFLVLSRQLWQGYIVLVMHTWQCHSDFRQYSRPILLTCQQIINNSN